MNWKEFELWIKECLDRALDAHDWSVTYQRAGNYQGIEDRSQRDRLVLDFFVKERVRGGVGVVLDAKFKNLLSADDIRQIHDYRASTRSSEAIIVVAPHTEVSEFAMDLASEDSLDILLFRANRKLAYNLKCFFEDYKEELVQMRGF